jgi:MFS family permease
MALAQQQPAQPPYSKQQIYMTLAAILFGYGAYSYFVQTLNVAAPRIAADLNSMPLYSWSVSIPGLGLAIGTLISGKLSDIYGRRALVIASMVILLLGAAWSAISPTFIILLIARTFLSLGQGVIGPLCFSIVGDIYTGAQRSRWVGLLNIPFGIFCLVGPTLGGWLVDSYTWRHIFWWSSPLMIFCILAALGMPPLIQGAAHKIDAKGMVLASIASATLILALSFAGTTYSWGSPQVIGLLAVSLVSGLLFLQVESRAEEPILDPSLLKSRAFMTACTAGVLSFFGMMAVQLYYPLLMQGIQGISAMRSGQIITPFGLLMAFVGIPTGFLLARTKRYKGIYVTGYALLVAVMSGMIFFGADTPVYWGIIAATLGGIGLGAIPTINTLVIQAAVPRKLMGVAMGALFFSVALGWSLSPALLGSAMNIRYNSALKASLPVVLTQVADEATLASIGNPRVLLSEPDMNALKSTLLKMNNGQALFDQTVGAIRSSMEAGLRLVFIIGAATMLLAFLFIITIPKIPI